MTDKKFGSKLQFTYPEKCPDGCPEKGKPFHQGNLCCRCPVLCCKEPVTEEDKMYMPLLPAKEFRDDWAEEFQQFFKEWETPSLKLSKK